MYKLSLVLLIMALFNSQTVQAAEKPSITRIQTATLTDQKYVIEQWKAFMPKLADCIPGSYQLPTPIKPPDVTDTMNATFKISGWVNDKCVINFTSPQISASTYIIGECSFSKEMIKETVEIFNKEVLPNNDLTKIKPTSIFTILSNCDTSLHDNGEKKLFFQRK